MSLRDRLVGLVVDTTEQFVDRYAPGFVLPHTFGGHLVGPDAVADVAFTLGWLHELGVERVASMPVDDALRTVLARVDGPGTHSFFSYRIAETLARFGPFERNTLLAPLTDAEIENLRVACDSTELLPLLDGLLPRNYLAVLARCELARHQLGILPSPDVLDDLVARTADLLTGNPHGFLDESHTGAGRFDIYAADIYLFCEPLADRLGDVWARGARNAVGLIERIAAPDGSAVTWGRSTGALSIALSIELAALATTHDLSDDRDGWLDRAATATDTLGTWFADGLTTAHLHRSPEDYRGPFRRVQMTFDLLGKLAYAAAGLPTDVPDDAPDGPTRPDPGADRALPDRDEVIELSDRARLWSFSGSQIGFTLPLVSGRSSDYLPTPRRPGLYESPVDSLIGCFVPVAHTTPPPLRTQGRFVPGETPEHVVRTGDGLRVVHEPFVATAAIDGAPHGPDRFAGRRVATYSVDGATLAVAESLTFERPPDAISVLVPSTAERPLRVEADGPVRLHTVPVDGMKEWQGAWSELSAVTEIEVEPATEVSFSWSVTPRSRVALTSHEAGYVRTVYDPVADPLSGRLVEHPWTTARDATDVAHIHWPEWCFGYGTSVEDHARIASRLRRQGTKIVWTQHNLTPHLDEPDVYDPIYQVWADACDLAIHHSHWGHDRVTARYRFRDDCRHEVIPHPHFGPALTASIDAPRDAAAERLGLRTGADAPAIRIGVIGAPRKEKSLPLVMEAVRRSARDDIELVVWSMSFTDVAPDDPRIVASVYDNVDRELYDLRLAACDAIALPFDGHTMLGTGTTSDLVATGIPGLISDWPYLAEHLGGLGITMGADVEEWTAAIDGLTRAQLDEAAGFAADLRRRYDPARIGLATAVAIEALGVQRA